MREHCNFRESVSDSDDKVQKWGMQNSAFASHMNVLVCEMWFTDIAGRGGCAGPAAGGAVAARLQVKAQKCSMWVSCRTKNVLSKQKECTVHAEQGCLLVGALRYAAYPNSAMPSSEHMVIAALRTRLSTHQAHLVLSSRQKPCCSTHSKEIRRFMQTKKGLMQAHVGVGNQHSK